MQRSSLSASLLLCAFLVAGASEALAAPQSLDLDMVRATEGTLQVDVHNLTGGGILHGTVLIDVAFANGVTQESRISIANLQKGDRSQVQLKLVNSGKDSVITGVELVTSSLKNDSAHTLQVPVKLHLDRE